MRRFLLPLGLFLALVAFLGAGLRLDPHEIPSPFIGKPAPAFTLARLHDPGATISPADMRGRVWLLNVWASWCEACRAEHAVLIDLARRHAAPVVGLNYKDARADGLAWLRTHGDPYLASAFDEDGRTGIDYGVYGVPETFVIDKAGVIRLKHVGPLTQQVLANEILPLVRDLNHG
jgi:cytochrome c biogenesis protein CcmG/thiol:disulfide interchange protein DsbE